MQVITLDAQSLTARSFSTLPKNKNVRISPDGKKIIYSQNVKDSTILVTHDLDTGKVQPIAVTDNEKMKLRFGLWASNDIVLFSIAIPYNRSGVPTMNMTGSMISSRQVKPLNVTAREQKQNKPNSVKVNPSSAAGKKKDRSSTKKQPSLPVEKREKKEEGEERKGRANRMKYYIN